MTTDKQPTLFDLEPADLKPRRVELSLKEKTAERLARCREIREMRHRREKLAGGSRETEYPL